MSALLAIPATVFALIISVLALILTAPAMFVLAWLRWFKQWD
jgi:hypothetical protein